jgi:hypothetical protein
MAQKEYKRRLNYTADVRNNAGVVLVDFISESEEESKEEGSEAFDKNTVENVGFPDWAKRVLFAWLTTEERDLAWEEEALTKREAEEANTTHRHTDIAATNTHTNERKHCRIVSWIFSLSNYPGYCNPTFLSLVLLSSSFSLRPSFSPPTASLFHFFFHQICRTFVLCVELVPSIELRSREAATIFWNIPVISRVCKSKTLGMSA